VELRRSSLPVSALASRLADEVLPPLRKGASTDHSTGLQAIFPVPVLTFQSRPADEVLPPLKGSQHRPFNWPSGYFPVLALTLQRQPANEVLPTLKKGASTDHSTGLQAIFPALTLASRLADEVFPPLKKGASTGNSTTDEVLAPLKEGAITQNSPGLSSMIVPSLPALIQWRWKLSQNHQVLVVVSQPF
jgi:hypothetical protein